MLLATSYLTAAQFKAMPSDYDITGYTDADLDSILQAASGQADAIMRKSYRAQEETKRYWGSGNFVLQLEEKPLLYVKRVQWAIPGTTGVVLPATELLIDYQQGDLLSYTPLYLQGVLGYVFPRNVPIDVTLAWGRGYTVATSPTVAIADSQGSGLTPGTYNVAVTSKTQYGETMAPVQQFTTASGVFTITPDPVLGVYVFRAYASDATHNTTLTDAPAAGATTFTTASIAGMTPTAKWLLGSGSTAEVVTIGSISGSTVTPTSALQYEHAIGEAFIPLPMLVGESPFVAYGSQTIEITVDSLSAPSNYWQDQLPTTDTSAPPVQDGILEAVRLLAYSRIFEQNNMANRGVYSVSEGDKRIMWRSTEGNSGRGTPLMMDQAQQMLAPYSLNELFFG